jgi:hypothetical protein
MRTSNHCGPRHTLQTHVIGTCMTCYISPHYPISLANMVPLAPLLQQDTQATGMQLRVAMLWCVSGNQTDVWHLQYYSNRTQCVPKQSVPATSPTSTLAQLNSHSAKKFHFILPNKNWKMHDRRSGYKSVNCFMLAPPLPPEAACPHSSCNRTSGIQLSSHGLAI